MPTLKTTFWDKKDYDLKKSFESILWLYLIFQLIAMFYAIFIGNVWVSILLSLPAILNCLIIASYGKWRIQQ